MKCPYCFRLSRFRIKRKKGSRIVYYCSYCKSEVPRLYLESPVINSLKIGTLGYPGHGKTVYKTALLYILQSMHDYWKSFTFETMDDESHKAMFYDTLELQKLRFPSPTRAVFPRPAFLQLNQFPFFGDISLRIFDTGGQLFDNLELMTRKGRFFTHANVIFFLISLSEEKMKDNWNLKIMKLLDRYTHVVYSRYGSKTAKKQDIAFILSKSDRLIKSGIEIKLPDKIEEYLNQGSLEKYKQINNQTLEEIKQNSFAIEAWLRENNCNSFINYARNHFRHMGFMTTTVCPDSTQESNPIQILGPNIPKCILDPLIWALSMNR